MILEIYAFQISSTSFHEHHEEKLLVAIGSIFPTVTFLNKLLCQITSKLKS